MGEQTELDKRKRQAEYSKRSYDRRRAEWLAWLAQVEAENILRETVTHITSPAAVSDTVDTSQDL
jgi:hypothetical protein